MPEVLICGDQSLGRWLAKEHLGAFSVRQVPGLRVVEARPLVACIVIAADVIGSRELKRRHGQRGCSRLRESSWSHDSIATPLRLSQMPPSSLNGPSGSKTWISSSNVECIRPLAPIFWRGERRL